ncbi:uncharacterized protein NECHADRAFT_7195, partial [Fusarium vanettenii 77-13-4]
LDRIIHELLETNDLAPKTKIGLHLTEIQFLCAKAKEILIAQPTLLELAAPLTVVGPVHGQFDDLLKVFKCAGHPKATSYLFLGNYVDFGKSSLESICLLLAYKIKFSRTFFLLRGNHESEDGSRKKLGFYQECKERYNIRLWKRFVDIFNYLPLAATVNSKVFCVHGGLGPSFTSLQDIKQITRPIIERYNDKDEEIRRALVDGDFNNDVVGWNDRGQDGIKFGPDRVSNFLTRNNMQLIVSGRKAPKEGYQFCCENKFLRLWTAPNWNGLGNAGAIWTIPEN